MHKVQGGADSVLPFSSGHTFLLKYFWGYVGRYSHTESYTFNKETAGRTTYISACQGLASRSLKVLLNDVQSSRLVYTTKYDPDGYDTSLYEIYFTPNIGDTITISYNYTGSTRHAVSWLMWQ